MIKSEVKNGKLLLAEPFMLDPYFKRAVVLICDHHKSGSIGFILNKQLDVRLNDLLTDFPTFDVPLYYGGPVQRETLHFIHNLGDLLEDSLPIAPGISWGGDFEKLKFLISSDLIHPNNIRFFVGYSGWSDGQLKEEMQEGSWIVADADTNYLFNSKPDKLWQRVLENQGSTLSIIAQMPDQYIWN